MRAQTLYRAVSRMHFIQNKMQNVSSEIEDFVETCPCKLCVILRPCVLRVLYDLMLDIPSIPLAEWNRV